MEKPSGIFSLLEPLQRERIRRLLPVSFEDIYDHIEMTRFEVKELELYLDNLFEGSQYGKREEGPSTLPC